MNARHLRNGIRSHLASIGSCPTAQLSFGALSGVRHANLAPGAGHIAGMAAATGLPIVNH